MSSQHVAIDKGKAKKKDRPPALDLPDVKAASDGEVRYQHTAQVAHQSKHQVTHPGDSLSEPDYPTARSESSTSSLDPYYFGISDSPAPPLPSMTHNCVTPEMRSPHEPLTPAKNPANIDRRGLVGVGELTTPRWTKEEQYSDDENHNASGDCSDAGDPEEVTNDAPDSPWTIEAIDGELDEQDHLEQQDQHRDLGGGSRGLRAQPSMTSESGGEEIVYPRKSHLREQMRQGNLMPDSNSTAASSLISSPSEPMSPPSSFATPLRKAKKRTSDEFELDQSGLLISKRLPKEKGRDERASARKHRSLGLGIQSATPSREKGKDRRRDSANQATSSTERHIRQLSGGSANSLHGDSTHSKRSHPTDFSHLPPSPSSSSIQQFLTQKGSAANPHSPPLLSSSRDAQPQSSPNVAHSLLRGTQEGWSSLDDDATAEALRKLDGLSSKTARARASFGSLNRTASLSRPGTPSTKPGMQWEGIGGDNTKANRSSIHVKDMSSILDKETDLDEGSAFPRDGTLDLGLDGRETSGNTGTSSDDQRASSVAHEKTPKKSGTPSSRSSFQPKRGSVSSTNYTGTPNSRDSASISFTTNATSISAASGRHSSGKVRRNSVGSDVSSIHSVDGTSLKDRVASIAVTGDTVEDIHVPPVPPLPKDLSTYRSPPTSSMSQAFSIGHVDEPEAKASYIKDSSSAVFSEPPIINSRPQYFVPEGREIQHSNSGHGGAASTLGATPAILKTPSKKWSFSALNIKLSSSPSTSTGPKSGFPLSPRAVTFGQQVRKSNSKDQVISPPASKSPWSPTQPGAMGSAASLTSLSSVGSTQNPKSSSATGTSKILDRNIVTSRPGTASSISTNHTTSAVSAPQNVPLSPTSSIRRGQSSKRLTPSSIPFFRRSSSQSMQIPPPIAVAPSISPTTSSGAGSAHQLRLKTEASKDFSSSSISTPGSANKKSSMLNLGTLLKGSSSRRSLHGERIDPKDSAGSRRVKESDKDKERIEKERQKKEDKERSESRISVLMGRKRGKTLSSSDAKKAKPVNLPPMQISAIPPVTAQRVANLKSSSISTSTAPISSRSTSSTKLASQTAISMQKQSDTSLRTRNQLPTIAGSPSVGSTQASVVSREPKDPPLLSSLITSISATPKDTPTKIPRISSRTSASSSPNSKPILSTLPGGRRTSVNITGPLVPSTETSPVPATQSANEFGVMESEETQNAMFSLDDMSQQQASARESPSNNSTSRVPRQASNTASMSHIVPRKSNRESVSFVGLRKSSTGSVASISSVAPSESQSHHRFSALSPSKGLKLLSPKMSLPSARAANSAPAPNIHQAMASASSSRLSLSTPSPIPSSVQEEELQGDEEMMHYIRRQHAKKMASGATQEELDQLLNFPEPIPPGHPSSPSVILKSNQAQYLSEFERKEILDYPSVYYIGARSKKKLATPDNSASNHGYDDERGDYHVINRDHLAYRYEIMGTLGKGSFGQVLHCRDHGTGESTAIKIIRNKKRFHHQALVEIKILDNLRTWDAEEKHHVIKMSEHFYFRNHLCIAMELLSINLYELIKANGFVGFTTALIRRFTSQMLQSLSLMRHHRIVHCDLKPENVLLRHPAKSAIKVIDFGSSCFEHEKIYTYIQSRFYRSPEVILGMNYHMAIDMWSLGCILAELYTGFPIFPGENEQEQLSCIMEVLGVPDKEFVNRSSRKKLFFDSNGAPRAVVNSKGRRRRPGTKTLAQVLRCNDEDFIDFISKCLVWDPERRIKPQSALRHPFISCNRRHKTGTVSTAKALITSRNRSNETPKKSQISAPTPLAARNTRTSNNTFPLTPSNSSAHVTTLGSSSRSYRVPQTQTLSSHHSSRTLNGFSTTSAK